MPDFTAKDVQALRQSTGAGMMDAKRALEDTAGDLEAAARLLRERGQAQAGKRSGRPAEQGAVSVANTGTTAAAVELRCETDFVAKSADFVALVEELADAVATKGEEAVAERQGDIQSLGVTLKEQYSGWQPETMLSQFREALAASPGCIEIMGHPGNDAFASLVADAEKRLVRKPIEFSDSGFCLGPKRDARSFSSVCTRISVPITNRANAARNSFHPVITTAVAHNTNSIDV